jgi:hypothetical protein
MSQTVPQEPQEHASHINDTRWNEKIYTRRQGTNGG